MTEKHKRIVIDLDGTLCEIKNPKQNYADVEPNINVVNKLKEYKDMGFYIVINTSRNMNTFEDNLGKINANTAPVIYEWLKKHNIPYDEIYFGKPWCGFDGFYIDDKAIRPSEFLKFDFKDIKKLIDEESTN